MFGKGCLILNTNFIFNNVSQEEILNFYFHINKIPCMITSPLREDKHPSFNISYNNNGIITFFDFGIRKGGNIITLLSLYYHISYYESLEMIYKDLISNNKKKIKYSYQFKETNKKKHTNLSKLRIEIKERELEEHDISYWNSMGIYSIYKYNIYPIEKYKVISNNYQKSYKANKFSYAFYERKDRDSFKIYQPFSKDRKWISNHDDSVWDLWELLPIKGNNVIITSSRKDAACLWENINIPATALQAESVIPKEKVIEELCNRFKNIYIFFDNDFDKDKNYGQMFAENLCNKFKKYNLINIKIPDYYNKKDPSDLFNRYGKKEFISIIKNLIKNKI